MKYFLTFILNISLKHINFSSRMNPIIAKQLLINALPIPEVLQDLVKEHLFIDPITAETKRKKSNLINIINRFKYYDGDGHVSISYRYEFQFQSIFCRDCGGYEMIGTFDNYLNVSHTALCSCEGFMELYNQNIGIIGTQLNVFM